MIARGKREARRPWVAKIINCEALKERNNIPALQAFAVLCWFFTRGDVPTKSGLAPAIIFRAFGAAGLTLDSPDSAL